MVFYFVSFLENFLILKYLKYFSKEFNLKKNIVFKEKVISLKYFEKKTSENSLVDNNKKDFSFKRKKKFKNRNSRPKNFTFKKYSKKTRNP